jgi:hypothetical protein
MAIDDGRSTKRSPCFSHGYYAALTTQYDPIAAADVTAALKSEFSPKTYIDVFLIDQLALNMVRLARLQRFDADALREELNPPIYFDPLSIDDFSDRKVLSEGDKSPVSDNYLKKVDPIYSRHESAIFNRILRIMEVLRARHK